MSLYKNILNNIWGSLSGKMRWNLVWFFSPKFKVGVTGVFINKNREVLLLKHVFRKKIVWELPSGILESGEKIKDSIEREVKEETGFVSSVTNALIVESGFKKRLEIIVYGKVNTDTEPKPGSEIYSIFLAEIDKLPKDINPDHKEHIKNVLKKLTI